ncbi:MAG: VCBS repeat-containing protein, partial [Bacteroidetes bacterium]|nr:VCBS repeat-containing protein [Bacteroidota bacterium]
RRYYAQKEVTRVYREGLKEVYDKNNPFCPGAALKFYDSLELLSSVSPRQAQLIQLYKALSLLQLGQEKKAVDILQALADHTTAVKFDQLAMDIRRNLALAYLRLGERSNCISGHSSGSCIFPIRDNGVYTDPTASTSAIGIYKQLLQLDSGDLESRWLLNIACMTIGRYPSMVPPAWLIPGLDAADTAFGHLRAFVDVARELKINSFRSQAGGAIVDDFNNDGYLDIVTSSWDLNESMHFFRNNADGSFTDISGESGLSEIRGGLMITQADYNNDGFTDILVTRGAWMGEMGHQPKTLLRNNGDGTFTDVTVESGILSLDPSQAAAWADFNNDGWLDLFIGNETLSMQNAHPAELWINNQDGTFTNVAAAAGCDMIGFMKGATAADYDRDG